MKQFLGSNPIRLAGSASLLMALCAADASAATKHHRLVWDTDGRTSAVIGFSPDGNSTNPYVSYGYSTNESSWSSAAVDASYTFDGSIDSSFVRLENLSADSDVFFRVCDQDGCGDRFWFKTAPDDNSPFVVIAGGDTRTGHTNRRQGNQLLAKIRPLAVMHGGDFTDANSASQMSAFLEDWELTYSSDTIDGVSYKRIYPLIPTHGNHEDDNYSTLCQVFGADFNGDGNCNPSDTYGAVQISPLLRVYTLNSQFKNSGWSSYASAMNNWLQSDLASYGSSAQWRFAQYHKPMFPHYTGKSDNVILHSWWAQNFYDYAMNLVVESDTHMTKLTQSVAPSGNGFTTASNGGTVYVGEGSWGAPARSANDPKSWTIDLASIQQFKVIQVSPSELTVRTAQFNTSAGSLSRADRAADPLALPANVNWWSANQVGEAMTLVRNSSNRSVISGGSSSSSSSSSSSGSSSSGGSGGNAINMAVTDDVFVTANQTGTNYDGSNEGLLADGSDSTYGQMMTLLKFDLDEVASCSNFSNLTLEVNVTNYSNSSFGVFLANSNWQEESATWSNIGGSGIQGTQLATFTPSSTGLRQISLSGGAVESWLSGNNTGLVIASLGGSDGVDMNSKETGVAPVLTVNADCSGSGSSSSSSSGSGSGSGSSSGSGSTQQFVQAASDDVFVSSGRSGSNYDGDSDGLLADGSDRYYGELYTLIKFDLSGVENCSNFSRAMLELNVTDRSGNTYGVYRAASNWQEGSATWNSVGGSAMLGNQLTTFVPSSTGTRQIDLLSSGIVETWLAGANTGLVIAPNNGSNGVDMTSKETGQGPLLRLEATCSN
ncbi:DNRLRE domain-containing protein [Microbulbifer sp. ARAS458-1]|uniref:DNRLRE domain-containing protein n=1 Tax=Microbulbifer sp. ARAS458-1 TaxID=3140242 RepID=UPI0038779BB5